MIKYNFTEEELEKIKNLYVNELQSITNISKIYNVDSSVIKSRLIEMGVKICDGSSYSISFWVCRGLTEKEAKIKIKTLRPVNIEYWVKKGFTVDEAILQIEGQKLTTLRGCIARYGKEMGEKIWFNRETNRSEWAKMGNTNINFWLKKGFTKEEASQKLIERQKTFSKKKCVEKHGEEEGLKKFNERQLKWSKSLSEGGKLKIGYSKISQELFYKLLEKYDIKDRDKIYFGSHNKEFRLEKIEGGLWLYDFTDTINKKIIEYNGDMYHGNPKKYKPIDNPHPFRKNITAQEMWDNDSEKVRIANTNGYSVLTIWDSEYRWENKQKVIDKCLKFLKNE